MAPAPPFVGNDMDAFAKTDVVIVGAGLAGLTAANRLSQQGYRVTVLERGEGKSVV